MNGRCGTSQGRRGWGCRQRDQTTKLAAQAMATAAAIAAGTQAYGDPVRWDNPAPGSPGHFDWAVTGEQTTLDITRSAASQADRDEGSAVFEQYVHDDGLFGAVSAPPGGGVEVGGLYDVFLVDFAWGVPSGAAWSEHGFTYHYYYGSQLREREEVYLGVRFDLGEGFHYGWVGVVREGEALEPFAWGYETDPGVPIYGPEPGTLSLLAFGAAAVAARRRRQGDR